MRFDHLSVKQGLSQGNVWDIHQDQFGFMWVGTEDGLNIYDGYKFTVHRHNPADPFSISANNVDCLAEDHNGNIWIGTQNGLNLYNRTLNRFERFMHDPANPQSPANNDIGHLFVDSKNNLWVASLKGVSVYSPETKLWKHFQANPANPAALPDNVAEIVREDNMKRIWIGTGGGLSLLNSDGNTFTNFVTDPNDPESISSSKVRSIYQTRDGALWVGTFDGGLNKMDLSRKTFTRYVHNASDKSSIGNNYVYDMTENAAGEFWIATDGALNLMDRKTGTFKRINAVQGDETALNSDIVSRVMFDRNDRMWVGTRFGGLNIYDKDKYGFQHYSYNSFEKNCLSNNNVTDFAEDPSGNVWITTDGGSLNYFDRKTGSFTSYPGIFTNNKLLAVARDAKENLWLGMWAGGVNYFDPRTGKVKRYIHDPDDPRSLSDNNVFDILVARNGTVWIATWGNGLNRYNPETDDFTRFINDPNNPRSISGSPLSLLMEDSEGKLWIGTEQEGVDVYDPQTGEFKHFKAGTQSGQLSGSSAFCLYEDSKGRLWIGTNGAGLNLLDRQKGVFTTWRQKDGLPNEGIMGILEDNTGEIWLSTNKGLSRFNPEKNTFRNYSESDGLQSDQFNRWAFRKLSTGELLFGGINGFNLFNPSNIRDNTYKPPVFITDFKLSNKPVAIGENEVLRKNILLTDEIVLAYDQNIFSFEFVALNFRQTEKNRYKYKLEGFDDDWIEAGTERKKEYTNISPGTYTFRVIASNNDGIWNEEGKALRIRIIPPFWRTWVFYVAVASIAAYSIIWYNRRVKRNARRRQQELEAIIEERTREVKTQNEEIVKRSEAEKVNNWITQGLARVGEVMSNNNHDLSILGRQTLKSVVTYAQAQQGIIAIGVKERDDDEHLKILATFGVNKRSLEEQRIEVGSGMLGETYKDKQKKILETIPPGYLKIESGLGESLPARIVLLPLKTQDGEMIGVIELAFLGTISDMVEQFLDKVSSVIALNIYAASLTHKTMELLHQSKAQTEELRAQEEEMRQNMEELEATSEEFRRRELEYQKRIAELELMSAKR
ncbi:MAG TPA: two-component regulator propeller domain-containing protein [Chryseosolibacter sp.]|nr:two-component regulator propeller domain-containing protein [Chryseosolibacter sp.]